MTGQPIDPRFLVLFHFARMQLPGVAMARELLAKHLERMLALARQKSPNLTWEQFLDQLYPVDAYLALACLSGNAAAWEQLFVSRVNRADRLLVDALRARALRLYPRDEERQETAVKEFWGHLYGADAHGALPVLARYDGMRPLVPWLIRTFQNWQISQLRSRKGKADALPDDDLLTDADQEPTPDPDLRWHEVFCDGARAWLGSLDKEDLLLLGLRFRYRLSQREVAGLFGKHEGVISRRVDRLRESCRDRVGKHMQKAGWTGDDLNGFIHQEMAVILHEDPRLSADNLVRLLAAWGKTLPGAAST